MALDLEGYIKQSYERPNRKILEDLGANEQLIEYLMETPGNMNWQIVESIEGSGEGDESWDGIIRLNAVAIPSDYGQYTETPHVLIGDVGDFNSAITLAESNPVYFKAEYHLHMASYGGQVLESINSNDVFRKGSINNRDVLCECLLESIPIALMAEDVLEEFQSAGIVDGPSIYVPYSEVTDPTDYIVVKYKTGDLCSISVVQNGGPVIVGYIESGQSFTLPFLSDYEGITLTDGVNNYEFGDTIIINSDIVLSVVTNQGE